MSRWSGTARGRGTADKICPETVRNQTGTRRICADSRTGSPAWARRGSRRPEGLGRWRWERRCRRSSWAGAVLAGRTVGPCPAVVGIRVECRRGLPPVGRIRDDALLRVVRDRRLGRRRRVPVSRGRNPGCSEGGSRLRRPNSARVVRGERSVRTSVFLTRGRERGRGELALARDSTTDLPGLRTLGGHGRAPPCLSPLLISRTLLYRSVERLRGRWGRAWVSRSAGGADGDPRKISLVFFPGGSISGEGRAGCDATRVRLRRGSCAP